MKIIADNLRITKTDIQTALKTQDSRSIQKLVIQCEQKGVFAIDVNTGPLTREPEHKMTFFIEAVQSVTSLPIVIDTSNPAAMEAGLKAANNKAVINGFSLEPRKLEKILPLAKEYDTDIVGFLLYSDSMVPKDVSSRCEVALELFEHVEAAGIAKEKLIIDPVVPPLAWEDGIIQARAVLEIIRTLPDLLGFPVKTIAGLSNLTTGSKNSKKKNLVKQSYLAMLASAGLNYVLMDVLNNDTFNTAIVSDLFTKEDIFSWEMVPE
jgi:5-methyltetrahydrofolate corrinoid/iron sulfur protein methyltransferase